MQLETPTPVPAPHSVHVRAIVTWLAIFPLVAIGMTVMSAFTGDWHPVLRALLLTAIVVPLAVYLVVPRLLGLYLRGRMRRVRNESSRLRPWCSS